ncbi:PKD-like domain-containing protein, partial [Fulvivirga sp.]|uniref:PKD-like domain-containing protein n=1 Tax=Fulvivirga sp. TaxID=1931237 RepID=UPI0032ED470D
GAFTVNTGANVTWTNSNTAIGLAASGTGTIADFAAAANVSGVAEVATIVVSENGTCGGSDMSFTITVYPQPTMSINNTLTELCSGSTTNITLNSTTVGAIMRLDAISGAGVASVGGKSSIGLTFTDGGQIMDDLTNPTNAPITITYEFSVSVNGCSDGVPLFTTSVIVNPNPDFTINNAAPVICSGDDVNITLNSNTTGHQINLVSVDYAGGNVTGGSAVGPYVDGNQITETLMNTTSTTQLVTYIFNVMTPGTTPDCPLVPVTKTTTVTVQPQPVMSINNLTTELCSGSTTDITLNSTTVGAVMRLDAITGAGAANVGGKTSVGLTFVHGNKITDDLTNNTNTPITITYEFSVSVNGCPDDVAPFATSVTVNPNPILIITNTTTEICSGDAVDIALNSPTTNHQINLVSVNYGAVTGGSATGPFTDGAVINDVLNNSTTAAIDVVYEFQVVTTDGCPVSVPVSQFTTVKVSPAPTFNIANNSMVICSKELTDIDISSPTTGSVIELVNVVTSSVQIVGTPAIGSTYLNGAKMSNQLTNPTNTVQTVQYEFEVSLNNCVNPVRQFANITINPIPNVATSVAAQTICDDEFTNITLTNPNNVSTTSFSWTVVQAGGVSGASNGSGISIMQQLSNNTNTPGTATYTITPSANGCNGDAVTLIVTVNPTPTLATSGDETLCSGESTNIVLTNPNSVAGTSFSWTVINNINSVSGATNGSGTSIIQSLFVNSNSPAGSVTYRITPSANNCDGSFQDVTVTVNPLPVVFAGFNYEICEDAGLLNLTASITGAASIGTWTGGNNPSGFSNNPVVNGEVITYAFNQADIDAGSVTFTLTSDDPDAGGPCAVASDQITVIIKLLPIVSFSGLPASGETADNEPLIQLTGFPSGGSFTGDGILGNAFNPAGGNVGVDNFITYTYTDPATGCTNSNTQSIFLNGEPDVEFPTQNTDVCENSPPLELTAIPFGGVWSMADPLLPGVDPVGGGNYVFDPSKTSLGSQRVVYNYTDPVTLATSSDTLIYVVYPAPDVNFEPANLCIDEPIQFNDLSVIDQSIVPSEIIGWNWQFFDADDNIIGASNEQNPSIIFNTPGDKRIRLEVISKSGTFECSASGEQIITIGSVPDTRFVWQSVCNGDFTAFNDDTILDIGSIINYEWNFDDGNVISGAGNANAIITHIDGSETIGTFMKPQHKYNSVGDYDVMLTVTTGEGCVKSYSQNINILPQTEITDFPYTTNFDSDDANWAEEVRLVRDTSLISDNSWLYSNTGTGEIQPKYSGDGFWWTGANNGAYFNDEQSWVNGPCFDFSAIERPMISMNIISNTDQGFDGTVLQYSIDGGFTWNNIGSLAEDGGINWYNSNVISAKPGNQPLGFGWTGRTLNEDEQLDWVEVKHNLNVLKGQSNVLLRVAFGSNSDNSAALEGFAFDDVYVGEKNRLVLVEHFTDSEREISRTADNYLNTLKTQQITNFGETDFTMLQYHINESGGDVFNADNSEDPGSRSLYYGISQAPGTVMDGNQFNGAYNDLTTKEIDIRALQDALFDIRIDTVSTSEDVLSVAVDFEAMDVLNSVVTLQIAVVETEITNNGQTYYNVLKKLLLGSEGRTISNSWTKGQIESINYDWQIDVEVYNPDKLAIIAFVQDKITREIYGAAQIKGQIQDESTVTSIGQEILDQVKQITVYPNPANGNVNFQLQEIALDDYTWKIVDQRGVSIMLGELEFNTVGVHTVDVNHVPNGVYYVIIESAGKPVIYRKLAIMNRH